MIPPKKSNKWIWIYIFYTIIIFSSLFITRVILGSEVYGEYLIGLLIISLGSAFIPCIGGFFGKRIFLIIDTLSILLGIFYMFYVAIGNTAPGWGDLTSIIGYLYIVGIGAIIAFTTEVVIFFVEKNKIK